MFCFCFVLFFKSNLLFVDIPLHHFTFNCADAPIRRKIPYRPPDPERIERMREKRMKELAMYSIIREIIIYIIFLWVLMMLSYGNQDPNAYIMKEQYIDTLVGGDGTNTMTKVMLYPV